MDFSGPAILLLPHIPPQCLSSRVEARRWTAASPRLASPGIRNGVDFRADNVEALREAFHEAVEDHIGTCAEIGKEPQNPYSGRVMFRISPEVHRKAALAAELSGKSLEPVGRGSSGPCLAARRAGCSGFMMIWLHLVTVLLALGIAAVNLALVKETPRHKVVGWVWITAMLCVTLSSFAIRELNAGEFCRIHGLTLGTLFCMSVAIFSIHRGGVRVHAGFMIGTMMGVVVADALALSPGRFIGNLFGY